MNIERLQAFFDELKRRKVFRVAIGYAAAAFVVAQAATTFFPALHLPEWTVTFVVAASVIGFPVALILAWAFDVVRTGDAETTAGTAGNRKRYRWLMIPAAVLVVAAIAVALVVRSPSAADDAKVDPDLIAVFPFSGSVDPTLDYLREGMVHLLAATMSSVAQTQVVHPRTAMDAWQRRFGEQYRNVPPDSARAVARALGAGRFLLGSIVGIPARVAVTADVFRTSDGEAIVRTQLARPADSLQVLVDHLTAQLLSLESGERRDRLANLTSTSLDALSAYLKGQEAFRRGDLPRASNHFDEAIEIDSTFALAAYFGRFAARSQVITNRRSRLAWTYRNRLPPSDRELIEVVLANFPAERPPLGRTLQAWDAYLRKYPDRAEAWVQYGEELIARGPAGEIPDHLERSRAAFNRALALDSTHTPALDMLITIATYDEPNRAELDRLYALLQRRSLSADINPTMNWARAVLRGDSQRIATQWQAALENATATSPAQLFGWVQHGVGRFEDVEKAIAFWQQRRTPGVNSPAYWFYLNAGRPDDAERYRSKLGGQNFVQARTAPIYAALFYNGDTTAARLAADTVAALLPSIADVMPGGRGLACALAQWQLHQGKTGRIDAFITALERPDSIAEAGPGNKLCAQLLRTLRAFVLRAPDARARLERLDSTALDIAFPGPSLTVANLTIAQLRERVGDPKGALRALRRLHFRVHQSQYLAPILRERGRLALVTGDTVAAVKDWTHYLKLRERAEPSVRPEVERIRQQLHTLVPEPRR